MHDSKHNLCETTSNGALGLETELLYSAVLYNSREDLKKVGVGFVREKFPDLRVQYCNKKRISHDFEVELNQ